MDWLEVIIQVESEPCRSVSQGVGLASCLPKTAWPPTSKMIGPKHITEAVDFQCKLGVVGKRSKWIEAKA